ncbi:MAG: hypothetical protein WBB28_25920 [Crinalium sp.]
MQTIVEIEGQTIPVDEEIANDDTLLRQLFTPYYPDVANARIDRKEGEVIKIIKVAGSKGSTNKTPLETLLLAPEEINPAVKMCRVVQHHELTNPLGYDSMEALAADIETAIRWGAQEAETVQKSLVILQKSSPVPGLTPLGF